MAVPFNIRGALAARRAKEGGASAERTLDERSATSAPSTQDAHKQRLRLRRFLLASAFSLLYLVVLGIFHSQKVVDLATVVEASAIVLVSILLFFALFRWGGNRRFSDPSLTGFMFVAAVATMLFVQYRAPETRTLFTAFFFVALMFGMLRARSTELAVLGFASLTCFALLSFARYGADENIATLRLDLLQIIVLALTFPWLVFIGNQVKRLSEADRRKDDFLATLAHELRNPLAPIRTGIQILRIKDEAEQRDVVLPMMERQVGHLTRLLDDLIDVSRISRGKVALHLERTDLRSAVEAAVEAARPFIEQMGHALSVCVPPEPVMLYADPVRLTQIVSNLLNNAARYTPQHGTISLTLERHWNAAEICVRDNGIGIPAAHITSIFEMFTQAGSAHTPSAGGLGIGLALVKGLVALHGGTIEARSEGIGRGAEFRVRLPLRSEPARASAVPTGAPRSTQRMFLIVDDNRDAASSLATLLELMGHQVVVAYDGEMAVAMADEFRPSVVLLDLGMPGMDGYEVCRRIRGHGWGRAMRIVAVTGWGQDEHRKRTAAAGFDAHLVKPVSAEVLAEACGDPETQRPLKPAPRS